MKTTLFLGAGASVFAEMPTTKDLVRKVLDRALHYENWESPGAKYLAVNLVKAYSEKDVEELYSAIHTMIATERQHQTTMEYKTKTDGGFQLRRKIQTISKHRRNDMDVKDETADIDETVRALESLETTIRNALLTNLMVNSKYLDTIVSTYDELVKSVSCNIVTTNYDNVLEAYCEQTERDLVNGFKSSHLGNKRAWYGVWENKENTLYLTKLHGSITWQKDDNGAVLEMGRPGLRGTDRDVMIAPTLGDKDYSNDVFPALINRFKAVLADTELLIVVGFSFRDPKITHMIMSRLERSSENPRPMRLLYVDPEPNGLEELVGSNAKIHKIKVRGKHIVWGRPLDEMPRVYAYQSEFNRDTVESMKNILDAMSKIRYNG